MDPTEHPKEEVMTLTVSVIIVWLLIGLVIGGRRIGTLSAA